MSVVVKPHQQSAPVIYVKGAPLEMLQQCDRFCWNGEVRPLTAPDRQRILEENDAMAERGLRVLAFAYRDGMELGGAPFATTDIETRLVLSRLGGFIRSGTP